MTTKTDSVLALSGFPPLVKNVPPNWPQVPTPNKLSLLWNYNYHDIYHKFSPFTNYEDNLLSCILSDKQPFVYTYIDESNKGIINYLQAKGIDSRVFYPIPLHLQKSFKYLGYKMGDFPQAEKAAKQIFTLPIYPELTGEEKDYIIQAVREFIKIK